MAITTKQQQDDAQQFADAYNEEPAAPAEQSEDAAFGIEPEEAGEDPAEEATETPAQEQAEEQAEPAASGADDTAEGGDVAGQTPLEAEGDTVEDTDAPVRDAGEVTNDPQTAADATTDTADAASADSPATSTSADKPPMTEQQLRSWEGRLRAAQAQLKAEPNKPVEEVKTEALEDAGEQAEATGNEQLADATSVAAEKVESGEMTVEQAMKQLTDDFGEDFVRMIEVIASAKAKDAGTQAATAQVTQVKQGVDDIIAHLDDKYAKDHFEQINEAHPDFVEIGQSQGFRDYVDALSPEEAAKAKQIVNNGSARQINKLLSVYKASLEGEQTSNADEPAADPVVEKQMDDAEGVRSSGMQLPTEPAPAANSYEDAWKEFE